MVRVKGRGIGNPPLPPAGVKQLPASPSPSLGRGPWVPMTSFSESSIACNFAKYSLILCISFCYVLQGKLIRSLLVRTVGDELVLVKEDEFVELTSMLEVPSSRPART